MSRGMKGLLWHRRSWLGRVATVLAGVVVGWVALAVLISSVALIAVEPETGASTAKKAEPAAAAPLPAGGNCRRFRANVENYNTLLPGNSRAQWIELVRKFRRDCWAEAERAGFGSDWLGG